MKKERFEAITDAVMAIILTLMVLEIKLPEISAENLTKILQLVAIYAVSFTLIAILWLNHHHIFENAGRIDLKVVWLSFAMLFGTSLLPMATEKISEDFHRPENHVFFGVVFGAVCLFYTLLQEQMSREVAYKNFRKIRLLNWVTVVMAFVAVPLSFVSVYLSAVVFTLFPVLYFFVSGKSMS